MRGTVAWLVVGLMVLSGCSDASTDAGEAGQERTAAVTAPATPAPRTESEPPPSVPVPSAGERVSSAEFCDLVGDIVAGDAAETTAVALALLQRGIPEDLDGDAHSGLQVLLDHAAGFGSVGDSWRTYRALEKGDRADLRALTWWVTKTCGGGYLDGLLPDLPRELDLPTWLTDPKLPGRGQEP